MKKYLLPIFVWLIACASLSAQTKNQSQKADYVGTSLKVIKVPSIASRKAQLTQFVKKEARAVDQKLSTLDIVIGKGSKGDDALAKKPHHLKNSVKAQPPKLVFETSNETGLRPHDPSGAVGPEHYFSVTNTAFRIFDKEGNPLTDLLDPTPAIFPVESCCDLTASYDNQADRWVISILVGGGAGAQIAVSDGPDPVNSSWNVYFFDIVNDYQKVSIWSDGYYMTDNNGGGSAPNKVHVLDREAMLNGEQEAAIQTFPLPGLQINRFNGFQVLSVSDENLPAAGNATVVYMQDDALAGINEDHIKLWSINVDWDNPENSEVSAPVELGSADGVTPFNAIFDGADFFNNLTQPEGGVDISAFSQVIMNQAQFRKFPTHNSAVFNFVVDTDGSDGELAGIRWYELRQSGDGQPWSVYQEGTYTAPQGRHAWLASTIMDGQGNIGMGYSSMSGPTTPETTYVGSYYTGRFASDPLGVMTLAEQVIRTGEGNIPSAGGNGRFGDYSKIDIDPANDADFWFVTELIADNERKNFAGVFRLAPELANDVGVTNIDSPETSGTFTDAETVTITLFNYGLEPAGNFDIELTVNGTPVATETFTGTISSATSETFTFSNTIDLSSPGEYNIIATTAYNLDENNNNDSTESVVESLFGSDIGVTEIISPNDGGRLGDEIITITIENFGGEPQSNFDISYVLNNGTPVSETFTETIEIGSTAEFSFSEPGDFSTIGDNTLVVQTLLANDGVPENNSITKVINNQNCFFERKEENAFVGSRETFNSVIDFTNDFTITDVNVVLNANHNLVRLIQPTLIGPGGQRVLLNTRELKVNDVNFVNTKFDDQAVLSIEEGSAPYTGSFVPFESLEVFNGTNSIGEWTLEFANTAFTQDAIFIDWTLDFCDSDNNTLSVSSVDLPDDNTLDFQVLSKPNKQFLIDLNTKNIHEILNLNIYNTAGQKLLWKTLENTGNGYQYRLNMSYAPSGIYFIHVTNGGNHNFTHKIVVN